MSSVTEPSFAADARGQAPLRSSASFYAWAVVAMLIPVAMLNYLDRMMLATMRSSIRADIPDIASDQDFGLLMALFLWVYAIMSPVGGYLADRFSRKWTVVASLFIWSLMTWLTGYAHSFRYMAWTRSLMGVSEAFYIPAALALIADFHPGATRSRAISFHMCGIYLGQSLGGLGGYIADTSSWRNAFYWFGLAGIFYGVFLLVMLKDRQRQEPSQLDVSNTKSTPPWRAVMSLLRNGSFLILIVYATLPSMPGWAVKGWLPAYLETTFHLKQGAAGLSATGTVTIALFFGALTGGFLADWAVKKTIRGAIYVTASGMAFCTAGLLAVGFAHSLNAALTCMILFGFGFGFFDANNMTILCQIVRPENRAMGYGIMNLASVSMGGVVTVLFGRMKDDHVSLGLLFSLMAAVIVLAGILVLRIRPKKQLAMLAT